MQRAVQLLICVKNDVCVLLRSASWFWGVRVPNICTKGNFMWIFMYRNVACSWKVDFSVAYRWYSGFCHCRVCLHWRAGFHWRTWSLEDRTSLEDVVSCTCPNLCKNVVVHVCTLYLVDQSVAMCMCKHLNKMTSCHLTLLTLFLWPAHEVLQTNKVDNLAPSD